MRDYRLNGDSTRAAQANGLADAQWYQSPVPKAQMRQLLQRKNGPAVRDTALWFSLLGVAAYAMVQTWGSAWFFLPFMLYAVLYASVSDSRWHESSHGTAFRSDWMNTVLYEVSSFLVFRESTTWRWSHVRHHTDTIIVGRDPEIASPRPVRLLSMLLSVFKLNVMWAEGRRMVMHALGKRTDDANAFVPESEWPKIHWKARLYVVIYLSVMGLALVSQSWLPLFFVGLPTVFGSWLIALYGYTQHAGLAENVLDHRLNSRTIAMNWLNRYLYWNMNYHVEHHMYPLVPYHSLPRLHALIKDDCPPAYPGLLAAWKEILPALWRQSKDPEYFVERTLPEPANFNREVAGEVSGEVSVITPLGEQDADGWIRVGPTRVLSAEDVIRVDYRGHTYAMYRTAEGNVFATEGICTHGRTHLADGFVKGHLIECPKHNGRFDIRSGAAVRAPACSALETFAVRERQGQLELCTRPNIAPNNGDPTRQRWQFRVVGKRNIASFICELELEPIQLAPAFHYQPGDYIQLLVPSYGPRYLQRDQVDTSVRDMWESLGIFDIQVENDLVCKRNYSIASNPALDRIIKLNVRLALGEIAGKPALGVGSSYVFSLRPGDVIEAQGPAGDFRIKPAESEMVYLGGGAGMAPLRSHISHLLETEGTDRKISFWYGARNERELIYSEYFRDLAERFPNFSFHVALSESAGVSADFPQGFIHEHLYESYLQAHDAPQQVQFYLCGPPPMMAATRQMLGEMKVPKSQIAFDEF
ncbi:fatty acid desaturase [Microbulbifer sp. Q7]|uniref:fatty acid desaturase n=1 Tax=Microbulbifer sp. Q7 TaxID=1785091 RepID=UPI000831E809|nr:fatty acid desaturase [Microbulbifer sp. Q7]